MQINTTNAISKALTAANKLVALRSYVLEGFVIVCGFRKVDKYMFRAYNTISVTAQRIIIRKGGSYIEKRAILLPTLNSLAIAKQWRNIIANIKHDASEHKSSYKDILKKEGLNKLEASRRVIFNCFKMQIIFKIYSSCKVKRFTLNSVKDLFTNLSKDYFLSIAAEDILGLREKFSDKSVLVMQRGITQHEINLKLLAEMYVSIIYFNLDSKLELKVLGKQDVKTTS
ncbi:hypothetical protein HBH95_228540 [Parastagonospora nodorum]|nr:hypothetical protein HBH95_228540 [Parastagonospora nodorum]